MSIKNVTILGGAFDPVHLDHVRVAEVCLEKRLGDEIWFVPSPNRWDKQLIAPTEDRFAMLRLAVKDHPQILLSDFEINMGDFRGSYVSMCSLREAFPDCNFRLLVGADSYSGIPHWRDPLHFFGTEFNGDKLLKEFELIVFSRRGYAVPSVEEHLEKGFAMLHLVGESDGFEGRFSSTEIRRSLLKHPNACPEGLLPEVYDYIHERGLYSA